MPSEWVEITTCGGVSSGRCETCKRETYFTAFKRERICKVHNRKLEGCEQSCRCPIGWPHSDEILCLDCYETAYEPEKAAARKSAIQQAENDRLRDLALALKGELPGAIIHENGCVLGPPIPGVPWRRVLQEGVFDIEPVQVPPMKESLSQIFFRPKV